MAAWRPLSKRGQPDPRLDEPTEGLPGYLFGPVAEWVRDAAYDGSVGALRSEALKSLQLRFKLEPPLNWRNSSTALQDLVFRMEQNEEFGLDVLDYVLTHVTEFTNQYQMPVDVVQRLGTILHKGGSAWEVDVRPGGEGFQLSRRAVGPVREAIESIPASTRAHLHLVQSWNRLSSRDPDPSGASREAVRAVEAAAKPVISPTNERATLGTMISALRDKSEKWEMTLGTVEDVRRMMEQLWTNQLDRHGTDDDSVPLNVSSAEADVAFHLALALVRLFAGRHIRPAT